MSSDLDILNQKLEIFGLDDSTLLSISKISQLDVGEVYEKLREKNSSKLDSSGYSTYRGSIEEDLITILTVNLREDSFGHIELVNCFKPEHSLSIDEIMKKNISSLPVPPSNVFSQNPGLIHHFYNILWTNNFLKRNIEAGAPDSIVKDLTNRLRADISKYLDNEAHVVMKDEIDAGRLDGWNYPARLPAIPGREEITEGVGRHMDGVLQIINGWKEIPIHEKHPHFHTFIKSYDPHLLQIFQDCMINQDLQ